MEKIKKYFKFSGTINGTNYFLRNLLSSILGYMIGYGIGYSFGRSEIGVAMVFVALFAPLMWFQVATIYKRMSALFYKDNAVYTGGLITLQLIMTAMSPDNPIRAILTLILLIFGCVLIFKNSNIENHEG